MAILPSHLGIKISVICNGAPLQEYKDEDAEENDTVVSKYVEAASGAEFSMRAEITPPWPPYTIMLRYYLDGKRVGSNFCKQEHYNYPPYIVRKGGASKVVNGQEFLQRFAFTALDVGK